MRFALVALFVLFSACASEPAEAPPPMPATSSPAPSATEPADRSEKQAVTVLFLGDSLTDGYGLSREQAYPALVAEKAAAAGTPIDAVNAGVSGNTSAGGLGRVDWLLRRTTPDVLVLALGANDGLRGLPTDQLKDNLLEIIGKVREANPDVRVVLAGMQTLTNYGGAYGREYAAVFPAVAEEARADAYLPFLLEGVAADPSLNLPDGVHPNARGQGILADNVWAVLAPVVRDASS
jgi:acyl-CoA thioesterase-1